MWGHGAYDRRYLGVGSDEFKRVFRASITVAATVSFVAFATKIDLSRFSVGTALVGALAYVLIGRFLARRILVLARGRGRAVHRVLLIGTFTEAIDVYTAVSRARGAGLVPVGIHLTEGFAASRGVQSPLPIFAGQDVIRPCVIWRPTRSPCAGRPATNRASCAGSPGSSRVRASTSSSRRSSPTSPARGCTSGRWRACRCCTSRSRSSPASRGCSRT